MRVRSDCVRTRPVYGGGGRGSTRPPVEGMGRKGDYPETVIETDERCMACKSERERSKGRETIERRRLGGRGVSACERLSVGRRRRRRWLQRRRRREGRRCRKRGATLPSVLSVRIARLFGARRSFISRTLCVVHRNGDDAAAAAGPPGPANHLPPH